MSDVMDWRLGIQPYQDRRKHGDLAMAERVAKIEQAVESLDQKIDKTDASIVRLHERVDQMSEQLTSALLGQTQNIDDYVHKAIKEHEQDEARIFDAKFAHISAQFKHTHDLMSRYEEGGRERLAITQSGFEDLKKTLISIGLWGLGGAGILIGGVAGFLWQHHDQIMGVLSK